MTTHNVPVTYEPKIEPVRNGTCTQTIRTLKKKPKRVGDYLRLYTWSDLKKPYRSPQEVLCWGRVTSAIRITITLEGIEFPLGWYPHGTGMDMSQVFERPTFKWDHEFMDHIAELDGIDPPTGTELGRVLTSKNKIPKEGIAGQIIRWEWLGLVKPHRISGNGPNFNDVKERGVKTPVVTMPIQEH